MYPSTVIGKILACFCALLGSATVGMLVSVLVDRYQRIHSRKKFLPEQIISPVDLSDSEHDQKEDFIRKKLSGANHTSLDLPNIFGKQFLARSLPINDNQLTVRRVQQQSHLRFIVSLIDDKSNKRSSNKHLNELIDEINDLIKRSQQNLQVKFVSIDHLSSSSWTRSARDDQANPLLNKRCSTDWRDERCNSIRVNFSAQAVGLSREDERCRQRSTRVRHEVCSASMSESFIRESSSPETILKQPVFDVRWCGGKRRRDSSIESLRISNDQEEK